MTIRPGSDRSLFISFGDAISLDTHLEVARLTRCLEGVRGILNLHPAYTSVLVDFDLSRTRNRFHVAYSNRNSSAQANVQTRPGRVLPSSGGPMLPVASLPVSLKPMEVQIFMPD